MHDLGTGREQVRTLIGALDALDDVGQACLGDLAVMERAMVLGLIGVAGQRLDGRHCGVCRTTRA